MYKQPTPYLRMQLPMKEEAHFYTYKHILQKRPFDWHKVDAFMYATIRLLRPLYCQLLAANQAAINL